jgi:putative methyltransferase (TIGR04325 family)
MNRVPALIPVVLFAYARPVHLARALVCLRENKVSLIYAFADGTKGSADAERVAETRALLRAIDWCEVRLIERAENLGLGRNVLAGVDEVAAKHEAFIVWEDDLICVPGTYDWICAALRYYADDLRVMSVSAWTHPRVTPPDVGDRPYFDARAECWVWGAWSRSWSGMSAETALKKMRLAARRGISPSAYGSDLPEQAGYEQRRNVWAVRWLYHHLLHGGLCLRPPWSMVEHIGFDAMATNAAGSVEWANPPLCPVPPKPDQWPAAEENPLCQNLWRTANPGVSFSGRVQRKLLRVARTFLKVVVPKPLRARLRRVFGWRWFRGDFRNWTEARAASGGYDDKAIVQKVLAATLEVRAGRAAFERDGVCFFSVEGDRPLLESLRYIVHASRGRLRVLDFGGSLGSTYWRHRTFLPQGDGLQWHVVEQGAFVEAGRRYLADTPLKFHHNVQAAQAQGEHDVLLCSCVLQYLEEPFRMLEEWSRLKIPYLLLNSLTLQANGPDRLTVQHVPPSIYVATYPVWFFNREKFIKHVRVHYEIVKEFEAETELPLRWGLFRTTGLLLKRRVHS